MSKKKTSKEKAVVERRGRPIILRTCPGPGCKARPMTTTQWKIHVVGCEYVKNATTTGPAHAEA